VDGRLPKTELEEPLEAYKSRSPDAIYASARFEVSKAGPVNITLPRLAKATVWIDNKPVAAQDGIHSSLDAGTHTLTLKIDASSLPEYLQASTSDGTFIND
jgi:hypothetical protein